MFTYKPLCLGAFALLALWPFQGLAADCEYETWNLLQANKHNVTALDTIIAPSWVREPEFRGTFSILQTCILTLTACVYTALHLNVPNKKHSGWVGTVAHKARWVLLALVGPEAILLLAVGQLMAARKLREKLLSLHSASGRGEDKEERACINLTYAFFVVMGGVRVSVGDLRKLGYLSDRSIDYDWSHYIEKFIHGSEESNRSGATLQLTPDGVITLVEAGRWDVLVSADTIRDKSKADAVQKSLVLLQVSWMAVSCTARLVYNLPITLLEIHTMVHVVCAFAMYGLWFKKPLDIHDAELITMNRADPVVAAMVQTTFYRAQLQRLALRAESPAGDEANVADDDHVTAGPSPRVDSVGALVVLVDDRTNARPISPTADETEIARFKFLLEFLTSKSLCEKQAPAPQSPVQPNAPSQSSGSQLLSFGDLTTQLRVLQEGTEKGSFSVTSNVDNGNADAVDSFINLAGAMMGMRTSSSLLHDSMVAVPLVLVYGGVHLAAWNSPCFPTDTERLLWRISCFSIAGIVPFVQCLFQLLPQMDRLDWLLVLFLVFMGAIALPLYMLSRTFVVVESFISLRQVPIGAYWVPPWLQSIPHV